MRYQLSVSSPIGPLTLVEEDGALVRLCFGDYAAEAARQETPLLQQAAMELNEYFHAGRKAFSIQIRPAGTAFQKRCWDALLQIPYGETRTYAQQAAMIGSPKACRAVGMSNHLNPLPVFIPCHRVVGKGGALTGYAGGLNIKQTLLNIERMT